MNLHEIELLLEKYFNGETSLEEEASLRDFFARPDVPRSLMGYREYFGQLVEDRELAIQSRDFDRKVMAGAGEPRINRLLDFQRPWIYWASGIAASILILLAVFIKFDPFAGRIENTYQDPQAAYQEAKRILYFVSDKLNNGTSRLQPVGSIETGMGKMKPVAAYNKGVGEITRLNQVDKANKLVTRN